MTNLGKSSQMCRLFASVCDANGSCLTYQANFINYFIPLFSSTRFIVDLAFDNFLNIHMYVKLGHVELTKILLQIH